MFYLLWDALGTDYPWLNIFRYITFRSFAAFIFSFVFVLVLQPVYISYLKNIGLRGQPIRSDGPKSHSVKSGTPTMGGLVMVVGVIIATLLFADLSNVYIWLTLFVMVSMAYLGFVDDWKKVSLQSSEGVSERTKILTQVSVALLVTLTLYLTGFSTELNFPFFKELALNLGFFFVIFASFVIVGSTNAVNLTDGLDGLAIVPIMTTAATFGALAYLAGNIQLADYLNISYVAGSGELTILLAAVIAAGMGFLWFNTFPAQVFMGDLGSMALGGTIAIVAIIVKQEFLLALAGGIFVLEALSVIIQRYYYKLTKKRVFKMAPIHHHFELRGLAEPKIIVRFWIISFILAICALASLKLR